MADDTTTDDEGHEDPPDGGKPDDDQGSTGDARFTQADLNRQDLRARRSAAAAERRKLAEQWGMSIEEVGQLIADQQARADAERSEVERATASAAAAEADRARLEAELEAERLRNQVSAALLAPGPDDAPGCDPGAVGTIADLAVSIAQAAPDGEDDRVAYAAAEIRSRLPQLFNGGSGDGAGSGSGAPAPPAAGRPHGQQHSKPDKTLTHRQRARKALDEAKQRGGRRPAGDGPVWQAPTSEASAD